MSAGFKHHQLLRPQKALSLAGASCALTKGELLRLNVEGVSRDNVRSIPLELPVKRLRGKASALSVERHLPTPEVSIMESCLPASTRAHGLFPLPLVFTCVVPR